MIDSDLCSYGLWGGKEPCSNRMQCLTAGEPKCLNLESGQTIDDLFATMRKRYEKKETY